METHLRTDDSNSIVELLRDRNVWLEDPVSKPEDFQHRVELTRRIAAAYPLFEHLRDGLLQRGNFPEITPLSRPLLEALENHGLAVPQGCYWIAGGSEAKKYLSGGWLEEYVAHAVQAAGADETFFGQKVRWKADSYFGENEIDVIARRGSKLLFCSCKSLNSYLHQHDTRTREKLINALHEADNLADHFSQGGASVALVVTTDLYNERARSPRYEQLYGKALALNVELIGAEKMEWKRIVQAMQKLLRE